MPEDLDVEWRRVNAFGNAPGPRDWAPSVDPLTTSGGGPRRPGGRAGWWLGGVIAVVIAALVGGAAWFGSHHGSGTDGGGPVIVAASGSGGAPVAVAPTTAVHLGADTPVGTCLAAGAPATESFVACTAPHRFELVSHARASGDAYPGDDYWNGPVAEQCYRDALTYTGLTRDEWPAGLDTTSFIPVPQGWAAGDRAVYCLAEWSADATVSVKGLVPGTVAPSAIPPAPEVLEGRLVRVPSPDGTAGCLGLTTANGRGYYIVVSATDRFSWTVTVDGTGDTVDSSSGIVRGADPAGRDFVAHTGDSVHLTGIRNYEPTAGPCGSGATFGFTAVG